VPPHRIELVPHDPAWALRAAEEAALIAFALGPALICVEHVGSTSVPGIRAKPIIDLLPVAISLEALDARERDMRALGYEWRGEFGLAERRYCVRDAPDGRRLFNVHCWAEGHESLARHIAFRDYLRAHPDEAQSYEAEKIRAASISNDDISRYTDVKSLWIQACQSRALAWAERTRPRTRS
jgi:GrpB-like predicted nucleotidyltransferase (UPF0157 family)